MDFNSLMGFISESCKKLTERREVQNSQKLNVLKAKRFGTLEKHDVTNLSSYKLTPDEEFVLGFGLNFSLPPRKVDREKTLTAFELFYNNIERLKPVNQQEQKAFKARLMSLAHSYTQNNIDHIDGIPVELFHKTLKGLKSNDGIIITKPDKGSGTVIMDRTTYVDKMLEIVQDTSKFVQIGPVVTFDKTDRREKDIQKFLLSLTEEKDSQGNDKIPELKHNEYIKIRPVGSERPRLYGLPKTHKSGVPLRPILSMISSPQHSLAKFLNGLLLPITTKFSKFTIKDSFEFAKVINKTASGGTFMASFDVKSLFTNVPLEETIAICASALCEGNLNGNLSKDSFVKLMKFATSSTEFSFNNIMYRQKDGVSMGSPLGPTMANIFMGYLEHHYFMNNEQPLMYYRYVDDCFVLFKNEDECMRMFDKFNHLHPAISFTMEKERNGCLPFLDVLVERADTMFITSIYRKPTFTGQYVNFRSFCNKRRKTNLIRTLCNRALKICSPDKLPQELNKITDILKKNVFPERLVERTIKNFMDVAEKPPKLGPAPCPFPIKLQFVGNSSYTLEKEIKQAAAKCYYSARPRVILSSSPILRHTQKDHIPDMNKSKVVYRFKCYCENSYVGQTSRRLIERVKEHVPKCVKEHIRNPATNYKDTVKLKRAAKKSAIAEHLLTNEDCGRQYEEHEQSFSILYKCHMELELKVLEAVVISALEPSLCKQTEFDITTNLIR